MTRPVDAAGVIRDLQRQIKELKTSQTVRVGDYVLSQRDSGLVISGNGLTIPLTNLDGNLVLPTPAEIGAVSVADIALAVDPPPENGGPLSWIASLLSGKFTDITTAQDTGDVASYKADNANAKAAELEARLNAGSSGYLWVDTFDRPQATDLGASYTRSTAGAGGGTYGTDGSGFTRTLSQATTSPIEFRDLHTVATNTHLQQITTVLDKIPEMGGGAGTEPSRHSLCVAANSAFTDRIEGRVIKGTAEIGSVVGGTFTSRSSSSITNVDGDRWDIVVQQISGHFKYILLQTGTDRAAWEDTLSVYKGPADTTHKYAGVMNKMGNTIANFWFTVQMNAPIMQQLTINDITT